MAFGYDTITPEPVSKLIDEFNRLPGIGPKSASRLVFYLLRAKREQSERLANAIMAMKDSTIFCNRCFNITVEDPCTICTNANRNERQVCVVEEPLDVVALERTGEFKGLYHVLHGAISPVEGINPEDLRIRELLARLRVEPIEEVILSTNPNLEGDATAAYLAREIIPLGIRVTRLARGLPMGSDLEYADEVTLGRALQGRREM
ncbi:MAG: recombination mediator RecR [Chloroflexi bacterium]|nr:recombination mediator RecR [Chloroflexota bacterium]